MSEKVRPSFDQYVTKKGLPPKVADAKKDYDAAVKKLSTIAADSPEYPKAREAKRLAALAMHEARNKAEEEYYKEEIAENVQAITEMKAEQAKAPAVAK